MLPKMWSKDPEQHGIDWNADSWVQPRSSEAEFPSWQDPHVIVYTLKFDKHCYQVLEKTK